MDLWINKFTFDTYERLLLSRHKDKNHEAEPIIRIYFDNTDYEVTMTCNSESNCLLKIIMDVE